MFSKLPIPIVDIYPYNLKFREIENFVSVFSYKAEITLIQVHCTQLIGLQGFNVKDPVLEKFILFR